MTFAAKAHQARGRYPWAIPFRWGPGTYGPVRALVFVVAVVTATGFLSAAIISVFIIWLPVALLSLAFGARASLNPMERSIVAARPEGVWARGSLTGVPRDRAHAHRLAAAAQPRPPARA